MAVGDLVIFQNPSDYSVDDYRRDIASPSPPLKARVVDFAVDAICLIHKNTPVAWLADQIVNDGKIAPEHIMLNDLCSPRNQLPPPPVSQFSGGQCPVNYDVSTTVRYHRGTGSQREDFADTTMTICTGPILSIIERDIGAATSSGDPSGRVKQVIAICKGSNAPIDYPAPTGYQAALLGGSSPFAYDSYSVSVARRDGQPDSCGDPPAKYPIVPIPPESLDRIVSFPITPTINAPVTVHVNPVIKFPPFILAPIISVNVGGINVDFSLGGFTLTPTYNSPTTNNYPTSDPRTSPGPVTTIKPAPSPDGSTFDPTEVLRQIERTRKQVEECCDRENPFSPPTASKVRSATYNAGRSLFQVLPPKTFQVVVSLTAQPSQKKVQEGLNAPDVLYAGWFWFAAGNNMHDRRPVDAQFKVFDPPARVFDSFGLTLYQGYAATIVAYYIEATPVAP